MLGESHPTDAEAQEASHVALSFEQCDSLCAGQKQSSIVAYPPVQDSVCLNASVPQNYLGAEEHALYPPFCHSLGWEKELPGKQLELQAPG